MRTALRVGVVGVGHLGRRHAEIYARMPGVRLAAVCDADERRLLEVAEALRCEPAAHVGELPGRVDAVSLAVPTTLHAQLGQWLLDRGIHVLIEKPIAATRAEADGLIRAASRRGLILQVGHVERFNAAIEAALERLAHPRFIEVHRLSPYPFRGTDVSVVLDLMIHDLDMILALVRSPVRSADAVGVPVLSPSEDIANARLRFASGCIANLTASRVSDERVRRIRVFQEDSYLSIDYQAQTVELAQLRRGRIHRVQLPVDKRPPLERELASFVDAVRKHRTPVVTGEDGRAALSLALRIEQAMRRQRRRRPR